VEKARAERLSRLNQHYMEMLEFVTHELKSPLASSLFAIGSLKEGLMGPVSERQFKALESVERNLDYLNEMITNYLNLSRIEKDELQVAPARVAVRQDVILPAAEQVAGQLEVSCMAVDCRVDPDVVVAADPDLLRIVFGNLLSNAIKYGRPGSAVLVSQELLPDGARRFAVRNMGQGIAPADQERLFKKFSRLDVKELRAKKGTGLGLFITRAIIERHGGDIRVESVPGESTTFSFDLPAPSPTPTPSP
jgi:signal transduction histidine kinase